MKSLVPSTPDHMPTSSIKHPSSQISSSGYPSHQISEPGFGGEALGLVAEGIRAKDRATLDGDSTNRVKTEESQINKVTIEGSSISRITMEGSHINRISEEEGSVGRFIQGSYSSSIMTMVEAPVTPFTDRENPRRCSVSSLTPLASISSHSCSKGGDFDGCCTECGENVGGEEEKPCSSAEGTAEGTPEHSTFDPFAAGPDDLIFAPKKAYKTKKIFNGDGDGDGHVDLDKLTSLEKARKIKESRSSVARVLCFDTEDVHNSLGPNAGIATGLANKDQHESEDLYTNGQLQKTPFYNDAEFLKKPSASRSRVVRVLDLDYDKHSALEERSMDGQVDDCNKVLNSHTEDVLLDESFMKAMCGSFLEAIIAKQCEDAMDCNQSGNGEILSYGQDQSAPATPVPDKAFINGYDVCPGAPMKAGTKSRTRGTGLGSVCRKLEF